MNNRTDGLPVEQSSHYGLDSELSEVIPPAAAARLVREASRVIRNWLPSASSFGLWVDDPAHLHELIGRLEFEVGTLWQVAQSASDPARLAAASGKVFTTTRALDTFLSQHASKRAEPCEAFPDRTQREQPDGRATPRLEESSGCRQVRQM